MRHDIRFEISTNQYKVMELSDKINELPVPRLFSAIQRYFQLNPDPEYFTELKNLEEANKILMFPYKQIRSLKEVLGGFDLEKQLPYVWHGNKKLFFPKNISVTKAKEIYRYYIETENILGGNYSEKAPHQYQTEHFKVEPCDVVLDIGAAEALFTLDIIEKAKRVYIFEIDNFWIEPLNATFEPYKEKIEIINKYVSDVDSDTEIQLSSFMKDKGHENFFIKMDIDGNEMKVIQNIAGFLKSNSNIRIVCCAYHKQKDAEQLEKFFLSLGYKYEYSDGYMIYHYDENIQPPYFRRGLIHAQKI